MVKKKICKEGSLLGHWRKEYVAIPIPYSPNNEAYSYTVEEIEVPENSFILRLIDPFTTPLTEIIEICEFNDRPFWWVTGIDPRDKKAIRIKEANV